MINERYSIAITETLHYLKGISQEYIDKIPNRFITFLKDNASKVIQEKNEQQLQTASF